MPPTGAQADTTVGARRVQDHLYRAMTPSEKLQRVADRAELLLRLAALRLGDETVTRA
jgi:hypothetical protein